jgi:hypothetical protein
MNKEKLLEELNEFNTLLNKQAKIEVLLFAVKGQLESKLEEYTRVSAQLNNQYNKLNEMVKKMED